MSSGDSCVLTPKHSCPCYPGVLGARSGVQPRANRSVRPAVNTLGVGWGWGRCPRKVTGKEATAGPQPALSAQVLPHRARQEHVWAGRLRVLPDPAGVSARQAEGGRWGSQAGAGPASGTAVGPRRPPRGAGGSPPSRRHRAAPDQRRPRPRASSLTDGPACTSNAPLSGAPPLTSGTARGDPLFCGLHSINVL